ncbi:hypothetical protein AURDEDRAFT_130222 [Auricularia subglabra TFB-10046 SS5]|uniref:CCHC-type domain-containing protein n=1 Tax=Auricularia subglabra (strain TFB-10046 / SS5) TaxID=717982 RepID=J0WSL5_AURST|nr:hypothetical protein AURDEDRAFT_130222 [Auricularia subglabra TFB-10046 SS5]
MADIYKAEITGEQVLDELRGTEGMTTRAQRRRRSRKELVSSSEGESDSSLTPLTEETSRAQGAADARGRTASRSNSREEAEGRDEHSSAEDTLDSDGFVVPRRVARARRQAKSNLNFSGPGTGFNSSFYEPTDEVDADDEDSASEKSEASRPNSRMSWAEMAEDPSTDPFGPLPEEWSQIPAMGSTPDPYGDIPLDWMKPEATSTPVIQADKSVFDELVEIAVASMSPKTREIWAIREAKMRENGRQGSGESDETDESKSTVDGRSGGRPALQLAAMKHVAGESDTDTPRYTAAQKGKGRAEPKASSSKNKYKATVELVTDEEDSRPTQNRYRTRVETVSDDEDPRAAQILFDESLARQILERDLADAELQAKEVKPAPKAGPEVLSSPKVPETTQKPAPRTRPAKGLVTMRYQGDDGRTYEVDLPIEYAMHRLKEQTENSVQEPKAKVERSVTEVPRPEDTIAEIQTPRASTANRSTSRYSAPPMPVRAGTRVVGNAANLVVPEHQMPLNSLLSRMYDRAMKARSGEPDPDPSSSDGFDSSSESSPSSESSKDSDDTKRRKRERKRKWKTKQRKLKLELAATKPEAPEKYNGAANWEKFNEFTILVCKYMKAAYIAPKRQVSKLQTVLSDKAKRFYLSHVAGKESKWTRDEFFIALYNYCFPADFRSQQREKFNNYVQLSLSVRDYEAHLRTIAESIGDITPAQFGTRFVHGLRAEIQQKVKVEGLSGETHDIEVLSDFAQRVELSLQTVRAPAARVNPRNGSSNRTPRSGQFAQRREERGERAPRSETRPEVQKHGDTASKPHGRDERGKVRGGTNSSRSKMSKEERERHRAQGLCFKCHRPDHLEKDCPDVNTVRKPQAKSLRAITLDPEEARIRGQINRAASMGLMAMRLEPPCEDLELLRFRDELYGRWLSSKLLEGVPYPLDPPNLVPNEHRFELERFMTDNTLFDIHDRSMGRTYTIDAATLYDQETDVVQWLTHYKCLEAEELAQTESVDWNQRRSRKKHLPEIRRSPTE